MVLASCRALLWYVGHESALRQLSEATRRQEVPKARHRPRTHLPVPDRNQIYGDMAALFMQDLANVEAGVYPLPVDHDGSLPTLFHRSRLFFEDLPDIHQRRKRRAKTEVSTEETRGKRPRYYLQNFHFQSGGWMTDDSAERYDTQVEVLFNGTANAIRRQALPQLREVFAGRDQRKLKLLDIGCGTGRFLYSVKQGVAAAPDARFGYVGSLYPACQTPVKALGADPFYCRQGGGSSPSPTTAKTLSPSTLLFPQIAAEDAAHTFFQQCARVLKPGGRLVIVDSLQRGDRPDYEALLELFPQNYHEPYYESYTSEDFCELGANCGLAYIRTVNAFVSKVMVFDKPMANSA